jgi:hypothetical protein
MKRAPISPAIVPMIRAAGRSSIVFSYEPLTVPNLRAPESVRLKGVPVSKDYKIAKVNVAIAVEVNTRQSILKVQKVFGLEISYAKSAPPIGAPKATLTPQEAPAAIIYRFIMSFWSHLNAPKGK